MQAKILGYILIALAPALCGRLMSQGISEEIKRLEGIIELIRHIKYEICVRMSAQEEIFARFENEALRKCGFLEVLQSCRVDGEKSVLASAMEMCPHFLKSDAMCRRLICDFAETLGTLERRVQEEKCDFYISRLTEIYNEKKEKSAAEIKLCRSMGALAGVAAVLILV